MWHRCPARTFRSSSKTSRAENAAGFNDRQDLRRLAAGNLHDYQPVVGLQLRDQDYKNAEQRSSGPSSWPPGEGANLLLNVGPRPDGTIDQEASQRLLEVGTWLKTYGETVYGTRPGPDFAPIVGSFDHQGCSRRTKDLSAYPQHEGGRTHRLRSRDRLGPLCLRQGDAPQTDSETRRARARSAPGSCLQPIDTIIVLRPASKPKGR